MDAKNVAAEVWANLDNSAYDLEQSRDLKRERKNWNLTLCRKAKFKNMNQEPEMKAIYASAGNILLAYQNFTV